MALDPKSEGHLFQIEAGTAGRLKGHEFEKNVTEELNKIDFMSGNTIIESVDANIYQGNPAHALVSHISQDKGKQINRLNAYWLGGLATAGTGANILNENGEKITGSKSDILMDVEYEDGDKERIGISAKACSNNAQLALTTVSAFCGMLKENGMHISENAEIGLKMFCGEVGYRPIDGYVPKHMTKDLRDRKARPDRWFWEELSEQVKQEWKEFFAENQLKITMMLLQCAKTYKTDSYKPTYIIHECEKHDDINNCKVAVMSVEEFATYSQLFDSFGVKEKRISKGSYKEIDLAIHEYPYFGFIQFQPIGNQQNFSELQFNLKSKYYNKFRELLDKKKDEVIEYDDLDL